MGGLNEEQHRAVITTEGRVLVLAGAGTGKTRVLTHRIAHLIKNQKIDPKHILGVTFTNKAAREMQQRVASLLSAQVAKKITLSTFHSFCMKVLRREIHHLGYTRDFTLYTESEVERLIDTSAKELLNRDGSLPPLNETKQIIYLAKQKGLSPEDLEAAGWHDEFAKNLYEKLLISMRAYNAVDFDHLLWLTVKLFQEFPDIRKKYQNRFQYVMIDEYQDTNPVQFQLAKFLTETHQNLCVVGDDDQSIYGWRGADIQNILQFTDATVIKLEQNYRSTAPILQAAHTMIAKNSNRHGKKVWSAEENGPKITLFHSPDEQKEAEAVIYRLSKLKEERNLKWKDLAILYRSNALSRSFEMALLKARWYNGHHFIRGIPYEIFGGTEFYERKEVKDIIAYLRIITNSKDEEGLLRIINYPRRGIGEKSLDLITQYSRKEKLPLWELLVHLSNYPELQDSLTPASKKGLDRFVGIIQTGKTRLETDSMSSLFQWLIEEVEFKKTLSEEIKNKRSIEDRLENIEQLVNAAASFEEENGKGKITDFLSQMALQEKPKHSSSKQERDCVQLMTFHGSKGLEFEACFLTCLEDKILPHERSIKEGSADEERRLFYVAMTRAKRYLTLSMAKVRRRMGKTEACRPSPFLRDLPKELLNIETWNQN